MLRSRFLTISMALFFAATIAGLGVVIGNNNSRARRELEQTFDQRQTIAAALFSSLLRGSFGTDPTPPQLQVRKPTSDSLAVLKTGGVLRAALYSADGRLLAERQFDRTATRPPASLEHRAVGDALGSRGPSLSDVIGAPPATSIELASTIPTPFGPRVETEQFPLVLISSLLPAYMKTMAQHGGEAFIVDGAFKVIGTSVPTLTIGARAPGNADLIHAIATRSTGGFERPSGSWHYSSGSLPGTSWRIVLVIPDALLYAPVSGSSQLVPWLLLAAFGLCVAAVLLLVERARLAAAQLSIAYGKLEQRNVQVEEANEAKSRFLAGMSHELRTPMNGIIGFAELMHDGKVGPVSEAHREFLGDILTSARHLLALINDVLDISKVEAGKLEITPEWVDVSELVTEVITSLRPLAEDKLIEVGVDVAPEIGRMWLDPGRLRQVLVNYLSNAIKFTPREGHVMVRVTLPEPALLRVAVEDDGIGIAPADVTKLFSDFGRILNRDAPLTPGTGLGLALTKRLVEAQGGNVAVDSRLGAGSVFSATIPCPSPSDVTPVEGPAVAVERSQRFAIGGSEA